MNNNLMWAIFLKLGTNNSTDMKEFGYSDELIFDEETWRETIDYALESGVNTIFVDVLDGVKYKSHPEIAVNGAWEPERLTEEVRRLHALGIDMYPKLNFSAYHDIWMKEYSRMVSTDIYYKVCADLIEEIAEIFDKPKYIHLGMDEEWNTTEHMECSCARRGRLYWHDLNFLLDRVREQGSTPCIWPDSYWHYKEDFLREVDKENILLFPWYYDTITEDNNLGGYDTRFTIPQMKDSLTSLAEYGYDVLPTGSNWATAVNMGGVVEYCRDNTITDKLKGFMMATWARTTKEAKYTSFEGIQLLSNAKNKFYK